MEGSNRKEIVEKKKQTIFEKTQQEIVAIYVFLMMAVYPFYYQNKYYDMGYAKWKFFLILTLGAGVILMPAELLIQIKKIKKYKFIEDKRWKASSVDCFVLGYLVAVLLSTLLSPYKESVIWGYRGWYMGLVAQLCFVFIYYFVSRYWKWENATVCCCFVVAFLVLLLAILMRFGIDPLGLYRGLDEGYKMNFLSTIGQVTWYSSYVAILLPLGVFTFWFYDNRFLRISGGVFTAIGFMTAATQNSDSIFLAIGILFLALFWISLESDRRFIRFLEVLIVCLGSFKFVGIFQSIFAERVIWTDTFSLSFTQGKSTWIFLLFVVACYIYFNKIKKEGWFDARKIRGVRVVLSGMVFVGTAATIGYICMNTWGGLPEYMSSKSNYLLFDEYWGNNRGFSWTVAVSSFLKGDIIRKLFGCGPDCFSLYVQSFFREELAEKWGESGMLACAHNEWLNALVNMGIAGAVAYIGIFFSAVWRFFGKSGEHPELIAIAISVMCYMGHNFFCYQQVVCTPTVFILIGAGEAIIRNKKYTGIAGL